MSYFPMSLRGCHSWEHWEWDANSKSPAAQLSPCRQAVYFHTNVLLESEGTAGVRGTKGFTCGEHYWEIEFSEPPYGTSVMVGLGTKKALLHTGNYRSINLLGMDEESWGLSYKGFLWHGGRSKKYTEPFYDKMTVIGVLLNLDSGTLGFYRNGVSLGPAFSGLHEVGVPLFPLVSSTAAETELQLGVRTSRLVSLQEQCLHAIAQSLEPQAPLEALRLPTSLQDQLGALCLPTSLQDQLGALCLPTSLQDQLGALCLPTSLQDQLGAHLLPPLL